MTWQTLMDITPFTWPAIGTSLLCGTLVGLERQLRGKPLGMRTSSLIVLGTYLFIVASYYATAKASGQATVTDHSRIIGQVVTGIGFLGAGVMLAKEGLVVGVTSAATIWVLAAIGVCIAVVGEFVAIKMSVVAVVILYGIDSFEGMSSTFTRSLHGRYQSWRAKKQGKRWDEPE